MEILYFQPEEQRDLLLLGPARIFPALHSCWKREGEKLNRKMRIGERVRVRGGRGRKGVEQKREGGREREGEGGSRAGEGKRERVRVRVRERVRVRGGRGRKGVEQEREGGREGEGGRK